MKCSVVIPVYNSRDSLPRVVRGIFGVFASRREALEVVLVNDGSRDDSWGAIRELAAGDERIVALNLMRNFGEHNAVMCGLNHVSGDVVVIMDDDGQNPPEMIPRLLDEWQKGFDVVYGHYERKRHHWFRNLGSRFNDRVATVLLGKPRDLYLCSFKALSRALVDEIVRYTGPYPYVDGLVFRSTRNIGTVLVEHSARSEGRSGYTLRKLLRLWLNMSTNFSLLPLRLSVFIGLLASLAGFVLGVAFVIEKLRHPEIPVGWASLVVAVVTFSGIQLLVLGVIGEYLGRLFLTHNNTPQYILRERHGHPRAADGGAGRAPSDEGRVQSAARNSS